MPNGYARSLRQYGYMPLALPHEDDKPLMVIRNPRRDVARKLYREGELTVYLTPPYPSLPQVERNRDVPEISVTRTTKMNVNTGVDFLKKMLEAEKLKPFEAELHAAFSRVRTLEFVYRSPKQDYVYPGNVVSFLAKCKPTEVDALKRRMNQPREAFVVTSVLKSNNFGIIARDENNLEIDLKVPAMKNVFSGSAAVSISLDENRNIVFEGEKYLPVGIQLYPIRIRTRGGKSEFDVGGRPYTRGVVH